MKLDAYITQVLAEPAATTRSQLTPSTGLHSLLHNIGAISETEIREWAAPLYRSPHNGRLNSNGRWRGGRTGVNWPEGIATHPGLIGTVHTHPYAKKLHDDAKVGFSIGDLSFYAMIHDNAPIKVHFVVCCRTVFLAVYRQRTITQLADNQWTALETDENRSEAHLLRHLDPDPMRASNIKANLELDVLLADQAGDINRSGQLERAMYARAPGYARVRWHANRHMILAAARQLRFDLYWGALGGTLHLKSQRTYFSSGLKGKLQHVFG